MKQTSEPIVFFGSGPVAAKSLELLAQNFAIEAVITKPRPEHYHGPVPVLEVCERLGLRFFTTSNRTELDTLLTRTSFTSRVGVLIDFGIIVSQAAINAFPLGIVNSHFSLLPEWRGADPITFAILSGQKNTGVSLMLLVEKMDEGPILAQKVCPITTTTTTPELTKTLISFSYTLLVDTLPAYLEDKITPTPQNTQSMTPSYSRKLTKKDGRLDWNKPAAQLEREIRAYIEWPKSYASLGSLDVVITKASVASLKGSAGRPTVVNKLPAIYCGQSDALIIEKIKPAGKPEMSGNAFLAGYKQLFLKD